MHELDVATRLVDQAVTTARNHGADRVDALTVELGTATHIVADQLRFCVEAVEEVSPVGECACGWAGEPDGLEGTGQAVPSLRCPDCGDRLELTAGRECRLTSIEIPDP